MRLVSPLVFGSLLWAGHAFAAPSVPQPQASPAEISDAVVTQHTIQLHGKPLAYRAAAGRLPVRLADGAAADMFHVDYIVPGRGSDRPVLFLFNGGPGSASLWLDLGSFGPRRVETRSPLPTPAWPIRIVDNQETLLDSADLVFVDAVGTGFSRVREGTAPNAFFGVDPDLESFAAFVSEWLTRNGRWSSPRYILGESYGATRAAGLAQVLQHHGTAPSGVVLLSSILNFSDYHPGIDQGFVNALPSMAATAWYHHRAGQDAADLGSFVAAARDFAAGPYADALRLGDRLPAEQESQVRAGLARFTGLSEAQLQRTGLRLDVGQFVRLLTGDGRMVGIYDTRVTARNTDDAASAPSFDAADTVVATVFPAANSQYLANELNYHGDGPYLATVPGLDNRWNWSTRAPGSGEPRTSPAMQDNLSAAMHEDPTMRVLSLNGYYDLGTPFFGTENDLAHMLLPPEIRANLSFRYYPAGHMLYLDQGSRVAAAADVRAFLRAGAGETK